MTELPALVTALSALADRLSGRGGQAIREHLQQLGAVVTASGPEARTRAARELEQLIAIVAGPAVQLPSDALADGLRAFVAYLRAPEPATQAEADRALRAITALPALQPVPIGALRLDDRVEALAREAVKRAKLRGTAARRAIERIQREMVALLARLDREAETEGHRTVAARDLERLIDQTIAQGTPLSVALAEQRDAILNEVGRADLRGMAAGLREYALWLSTSAHDPQAQVGALRTRLSQVLGPQTFADARRSDDERRADYERQAQAGVEQILGSVHDG